MAQVLEGNETKRRKISTEDGHGSSNFLPAAESSDVSNGDGLNALRGLKGEKKESTAEESAGEMEAGSAASSSSSTSDSSSSSTSSDSDSGGEEGEARETAPAEVFEEEEKEIPTALPLLKRAILRREEICKFLTTLPEEVAEETIHHSFVRLVVPKDSDGRSSALAEVIALEPCAPVFVSRLDGRKEEFKMMLRCKRGASIKSFKLSCVSNQDATQDDFDQWNLQIRSAGLSEAHFADQYKKKAEDIMMATSFVFDDAAVCRILQNKGVRETHAQKETRTKFLVQCAQSQMDTTNIMDIPAGPLEKRYKDALTALRWQEVLATKVQSDWFKTRTESFGLTMINKKNRLRQVKADERALTYAQQDHGTGASQGLNPFERRACRPVQAWDTTLTELGSTTETRPTDEAAPEAVLDDDASCVVEEASPPPPPPPPVSSPLAAARTRMKSAVVGHMGAQLLEKYASLARL